jgi:stage II sporulation protein D
VKAFASLNAEAPAMRRILVPLILLVLLAPAAGARPDAAAPPAAGTVGATTFLVTGRGYGHGVGMSQYGALGFAQNGATYDQILVHYYPGTDLGPAGVTTMRVLLAESKPRVAIMAAAPATIRDGAGETHVLLPRTLTLGPKLVVALEDGTRALPGPLVLRPGAGSTLRLDGKAYRGELEVRTDGKKLSVVNRLGLEAYLQGVVPGEMPSDWPAEALKAQAVAARSYALAQRVAGKSFDVYADVRSQVYGGLAVEKPSTTAAVRDTASEAVLYDGKPAVTYFYSTSGGRTAGSDEIFEQPRPYLVSVDDPYDTLSPYHRWGPVVVPAAKVRSGLKVPGEVLDVAVAPGPSGRARTVTVRTSRGDQDVRPTNVRFGLGLRSTWFRFGVLSLRRPSKPAVAGGAIRLTGTVRGVAGVTLSVSEAGLWKPLQTVPAGAFSIAVRPAPGTLYRLASAAGLGPVLRAAVAPKVTFDGGAGTVTPPLPNALVLLERQDGTVWNELARGRVAEDGTYLFGVRLGPGTYRVRVPATRGYAVGLSPELRLG